MILNGQRRFKHDLDKVATENVSSGLFVCRFNGCDVKTLIMVTDVSLPQKPPRRTAMFRALSHRNFRLFWTGAFLSNVGTWMQAVAQSWLVLTLTNSAFWLGLDAFMATAPGFLFTLAGGVFADLVDRRRLLLYTQVVAGLAAVALATLVYTNIVNKWI